MILEAILENNIKNALSSIVGEDCQIVCSRETTIDGLTKSEENKTSLIAIYSGFRNNDAFSLSPISVTVGLAIQTRVENDPTGQKHEQLVEIIADKLSYWHKFALDMTNALSSQKFKVGELRMSGGTGRTLDKSNRLWTDTLSFTLRGSEIFNN